MLHEFNIGILIYYNVNNLLFRTIFDCKLFKIVYQNKLLVTYVKSPKFIYLFNTNTKYCIDIT